MGTNNLHGGIMQTFPFPLRNFEVVDVERSSFLQTANDSAFGFYWKSIWILLMPSTTCTKIFQWLKRRRKFIAICCPSVRWVYWIQQAIDVLPHRSLNRRYLRRKIPPFITIPWSSTFISASKLLKKTSGPSVHTRKVVRTLHRLEHQNANSVEEQVRKVIS